MQGTGFGELVISVLIFAIQIGIPIAVVWLLVRLITKKSLAETQARMQVLEERISELEGPRRPEDGVATEP